MSCTVWQRNEIKQEINFLRTLITSLLISLSIISYLLAEETYKIDIDSKGIKTFYNKKPADPNLKIELREIATITNDLLDSLKAGRFIVYDFDFDKDGNIIILDYQRMWKFSRNGRFIKKFSRQGNGPGELSNARSFYMLKDTIHVIDLNSAKVIKFDNACRFINNIKVIKYSDFPSDIFAVGENYLLGSKFGFDINTFKKTDRIMMYDTKTLKLMKTLFKREYKKKGTALSSDDYFLFTGDEREFFVVENSYDEYKIDSFDSKTGKLKYKIRKNYIRVKDDEEVQTQQGVYNGEKFSIQTTGTSRLKESINWIYYDEYDRLWVDSNNIDDEDDGNMYFDIFKDGVFLNRIKLDLGFTYAWAFRLNGNNLVVFDEDSNVHFYEF